MKHSHKINLKYGVNKSHYVGIVNLTSADSEFATSLVEKIGRELSQLAPIKTSESTAKTSNRSTAAATAKETDEELLIEDEEEDEDDEVPHMLNGANGSSQPEDDSHSSDVLSFNFEKVVLQAGFPHKTDSHETSSRRLKSETMNKSACCENRCEMINFRNDISGAGISRHGRGRQIFVPSSAAF